jgi:DNA-binding MarR family transcriptional regulator
VRRERDDQDRRKVYISIVPEKVAGIGKLYEHLQQAMLKRWGTYSDDELQLLLRFTSQGYETMLASTEELKGMIARATAGKRSAAKKPRRAR